VTSVTQPLIDQASGFIKDQVGQIASTISTAASDVYVTVVGAFADPGYSLGM
jgi:hypothetical protein